MTMSCFAVYARTLFCIADEQNIEEAETLASEAASNWILVLLLVLDTTELQQQTISVLIGGT